MTTAFVTGANRGLGLEFTRQLLDRGDTVLATARRPARSDALKRLQAQHPDRLSLLPLDVSDPASIAAVRQEAGGATEHLDLLINNAGINSKGVQKGRRNVRFGSLEPQGILQMVAVNAIGPLLVTQALADLLQRSTAARVVSISSWLGSIGGKTTGGNYGYCASKTTLNMLGRAMAFDLQKLGVTAVLMNPGWVSTDMGGPNAPSSPEQSVAGMLAVTDGLTPDDAGRFLQWDGGDVAW